MAKTTLTISSKNYSSWSLRGWLLAKFSGIEFDEVVTAPDDASARAEILLLSSSILVPCLRHEGATVWDIFFTRANRDVIMQCDLGHMGTADADQVAYISKYPGRSATVHVKPAHAAPLLGDTPDTNKWPEIFKACESVGGTEWYIVEYDGGSMDKVVRTMDVLKKWGKL